MGEIGRGAIVRVLVTGHKGYIGSVLVRHLLEAGHTVQGMDADLFERCEYGPSSPAVPYVRKDIRDAERSDFEAINAVIHLAGLCNDASGNLNPQLTHAINANGTARLAELARSAGVSRFLFSSSCSVYGAAGDALLDEHAAFHPVSHYARSKIRAEQELQRLARDDFSPVCLRNPTLYGLSSRMRFDLVVNNLVAWGVSEGAVYLKSDGQAWRPIAHVADAARVLVRLLELPRESIHGQAFNVVGCEQNYRISEVAHLVAEALAGCPVVHDAAALCDERCYRVEGRKLERTLCELIQPVRLVDGVRALVEACRRYPVRSDEFEGPALNRVEHLAWLCKQGMLDDTLRRPETVLP